MVKKLSLWGKAKGDRKVQDQVRFGSVLNKELRNIEGSMLNVKLRNIERSVLNVKLEILKV